MWLPDTIYRRAPYYWMLLGVLFVSLGTFWTSQGSFEIGLTGLIFGVASCFWSLQVALRRRTLKESTADNIALDQTCELNYKPD